MRQSGTKGGDLRCRQWQGAIAMTEIWGAGAIFQERVAQIRASLSRERSAAMHAVSQCPDNQRDSKSVMRMTHGSR